MTVSAKKEVEKLLHRLPDDSTLSDIQYHLYVLEKIKRGRAAIKAGRSYSNDDAKLRLSRWLQG